jgi:hypothetical protein
MSEKRPEFTDYPGFLGVWKEAALSLKPQMSETPGIYRLPRIRRRLIRCSAASIARNERPQDKQNRPIDRPPAQRKKMRKNILQMTLFS